MTKEDPRGLRKEGLKRIVVGNEYIAVNFLRWRFVSEAAPGLQSLSEVIPIPDLLTCPAWVDACISQYVVQRASGKIPEPAKKERCLAQALVFFHLARPATLPAVVAGRLDPRLLAGDNRARNPTLVSPEEYLVLRGSGDSSYYLPYLLNDFDEPDFVHPLLDFYWAIPGRLLVGPSPAVRDAARTTKRAA